MSVDHRVLVFAPIGRDGPASVELFRSSNLEATICQSLAELVSEMTAGVGAVFLAEEGIFEGYGGAGGMDREPAAMVRPPVYHSDEPSSRAGGRCMASRYHRAAAQRFVARKAGSADDACQRRSVSHPCTPPSI